MKWDNKSVRISQAISFAVFCSCEDALFWAMFPALSKKKTKPVFLVFTFGVSRSNKIGRRQAESSC